MAMIDYGAIAFKNRKLISTGMFTPMKDTCGWSDLKQPVGADSNSLDCNYFVICGDRDFVVAFYRERICWWYKDVKKFSSEPIEWFNCTSYYRWKAWRKYLYPFNSTTSSVLLTVIPHNGYYIATWTYRGDNYKVYFGYGVDYLLYKKWHIVNYYRSLSYIINKVCRHK